MSMLLGAKALKSLCKAQDGLAFYQAKFGPALFKGDGEGHAFEFVQKHYDKFSTLPTLATLEAQFPEIKELDCPEPPAYYVDQLETRYAYDLLDLMTRDVREKLKEGFQTDAAEQLATEALGRLKQQRFRTKILDVGKEAPELLLTTYNQYGVSGVLSPAYFGWPYLDDRGGILPGEVASIVGRPASGKTYQNLAIALHNWHHRKENVLFVSMEMSKLAIAQRVGAMYAHTNVSQLKVAGYATPTFKLFVQGLKGMGKEPAKFYVVDANLGGTVEDFFGLADLLKCNRLVIDGAYLIKHRNPRLNRYERVAENAEMIKQYTAESNRVTICSWQFARTAADKMKKSEGKTKAGLEDIGYSDVIGQTSALVLGIMQEEGVETLVKRRIEMMKGREGQVGGFDIHWDFVQMNFGEYGLTQQDKEAEAKDELEFL